MRTRTMIAWMGLLLVVVALVWPAGSATGLVTPTAAPVIASALVSADQTTLTITGLNLATTTGGNAGVPSVSFALTPLPVAASSVTLVTATLPASLQAGTYLLLLSRSDGEAAAFYVTVGAVGPQGPAGPAAEAAWQ